MLTDIDSTEKESIQQSIYSDKLNISLNKLHKECMKMEKNNLATIRGNQFPDIICNKDIENNPTLQSPSCPYSLPFYQIHL